MALTKITSNVLGNNAVTSAKIALSNTGLTFNDGSNQMTAASGFGFKNRVINGAMTIDQRNAGNAVTINGATNGGIYLVDRFIGPNSLNAYTTTAAICTAQQVAGPVELGFAKSFKLTVTTPGVGGTLRDMQFLATRIETGNMADVGWGTAAASAMTLSFWIKSSMVGQRSIFIYAPTSNRTLIPTFTIDQANTWEYKTILIPADTSGALSTTLNSEGIRIEWRTSCTGASILGSPVTQWTALGSQRACTGDVDFFGTASATLEITGIQLEKGPTATAFDYRSYGHELSLCQRYYQKYGGEGVGWQSIASGQVESASLAGMNLVYVVPMRGVPTVTKSGDMRVHAGTNWMTFTIGTLYAGKNSCSINLNISGGTGGQGMVVRNYNDGAAYMDFSAEI